MAPAPAATASTSRATAIGTAAILNWACLALPALLRCSPRPVTLRFERAVWPSMTEWGALVLMGAGPTGLAFFVWDVGMKRGNIKALGGLSYATPLLSTLLLILAGRARPSMELALACFLIVGGAVLASRDLWGPRGKPA